MHDTYELALVLLPSLSEAEEGKFIEDIKKLFPKNSKILTCSKFGKRKLAYPIKETNEANYWIMTYQAESAFTKNLSEKLMPMKEVLRFLVLNISSKLKKEAKQAKK
jgi:small subunit ribosomal protein S6